MSRSRIAATAIALTALALGAAACSSSDSDADTTTTSTTEATSTTAASDAETAATIRFDTTVQQELADVGCDPGPVDGTFGPKTDAAIVRFQIAAGLTADGEFGPRTQVALTKAVEAGDAICEKAPATTTTAVTTTTAANGQAPCTATALLKGLPAEGESIGSYICSGGYAAGTLSDGTTKFILQSNNGTWFAPSQDPCGSASAGLPPEILADGCSA